MPRNSSTTRNAKTTTPTPVVSRKRPANNKSSTPSTVVPRAKPSKKKEVKKEVVDKVVDKEVVDKEVEEVEEVEEEVVSDVESDHTVATVDTVTGEKKKRHVPTKDSVVESFDDLVSFVEEEINRLRESQTKAKGVKFLRTLNKRVKSLRSQTSRVMKQRTKTNRKNNHNSGFLKPVQISKELARFTGWDHEDLKSRVDVTKYICDYIRENDLQNPTDRRQILADSKLSKLLNYDSKKDEKPLTYYRIQTYIKPHFPKKDPVTASA
jgi:upstream activation factor subunit UAF30